MTDKPRLWPTIAKAARDKASETAIKGMKALAPLLDDGNMTESERIRRVSRALICLQEIARLLESVGAPTRPDYD